MHITIVTIGSRGDVQPFVALGVGLQQAGYSLWLATHANFARALKNKSGGTGWRLSKHELPLSTSEKSLES